jgi:signal peptidase I
MTTIAMPMVHDSIPIIKKKSYLSWPALFKLPAIEEIKRTDIVVFRPVDTVHYFFEPKGSSWRYKTYR